MNIQIGDTVKVWKWVYDTSYGAEGAVDKVDTDKIGRKMIRVNGDWYEATNDELNKCENIRPTTPIKQKPVLQEWQSMDISSGLGIGGAGSDDFNISTERDVMTVDNSGCQWKHGTRYDEKCESCGRYSFEICNDCGCCERCHHA